MLVSKQTHVL